MVHEDDDHSCIPNAIMLLGILLGIPIRFYTEPLMRIVCDADLESVVYFHEGLSYRFEMRQVMCVLWQLHSDAVVLHEVLDRRFGPLKSQNLG